jgi:hypothetical protein
MSTSRWVARVPRVQGDKVQIQGEGCSMWGPRCSAEAGGVEHAGDGGVEGVDMGEGMGVESDGKEKGVG